MILDSLSQWRRYAGLNDRFTKAFEFLEAIGADIDVGRRPIDGDAVYAIVQRYRTKPVEGMLLEAHRRYVDIQYVVSGREVIHWSPLGSLAAPAVPYDPEKDAALYPSIPGMTPVRVVAGQFAILFPDDAHAPSCVWDDPDEVLKVVVKVEV